MKKFYFTDNTLRYNRGISHACDIKQLGFRYDIIVRGIIYEKEKIIYLRINDLAYYYGIEQKKAVYQFNNNLQHCKAYLKNKFRRYSIFDSYTINKLPERLQKDILIS